MKALLLVLLLAALGAGALFFVLEASGDGRGAREEQAAPARTDPRAPSSRGSPAEVPTPTPARTKGAPTRQSVEAGAAPELRSTFEGAVIGESAPIPGASVEIVQQTELLAEGLSDARGRFRLESPPLRLQATLRVTARGFAPVERSLPARPSGGTMMLGNLRLLRGQRLEGRVLDQRGNGIADAELRVEPAAAAGDLLVARARSGPDGRFEVLDAPPGPVRVSARAKGFGERTQEYSPGPVALELRLAPGLDLPVRLLTPRGQPVAGAEVTIQAPSDPRASPRMLLSDADGRALFDGLGTPTWNVRVTHSEYRPSGLGQVQATGREEIIECKPWPGVFGQVRTPDGGPPPAGTLVQALPASAPSDRIGTMVGGTAVGSDGVFRLSGLRPGDWRVVVSAPGYAPTTSGPVKLGIDGDGHAGTILLQAGGRLDFELTLAGQPLAGAEIELFGTPPSPAQLWALASSRGSGLGRRARSGADGRATLADLSPGRVWVALYAEGCPPRASGPHEVLGGDAPGAPLAVAMERGGRVLGRVQASSGAPVAHAQLRLVDASGRLGFPLTFASEEDGSYTSAWLPAGRYSLEAFSSVDPTRRSGSKEVVLESGQQHTLDLTL